MGTLVFLGPRTLMLLDLGSTLHAMLYVLYFFVVSFLIPILLNSGVIRITFKSTMAKYYTLPVVLLKV